uniref:Disease resistance protein RGA3 n=2 Tax=Triticum urartu TaxID=4572 RepID=A0A8R7PYW0_TRIUA
MAEAGAMIASAVGNRVAIKLGELVNDEIALLWGFRDEVEGLEEKMKDLEAVMRDADNKLRRGEEDGEAVGRWLTKFKSVAYDVEDVLDDLDANELVGKTQSKIKLFFSRNNQLLQRMTMAHHMKSVREKVDKIEKEGHRVLNLVGHENRRATRPLAEGSRNKETFAASMKTGIVGREADMEKIISVLLRSEANEDISVVPIVGLGGIGKSTLAESILADKRVNVFDVQVWVHVSKHFDLHQIGSAILKRINSSINLDNCTLQFLHDSLRNELATKRYLIVLDDLWEEDGNKLEELKRMLQYGCKGSRIIVTTRNQSIVAKMSTGILANRRVILPVPESYQIKLDILSTDNCWDVMKQRVFEPDDDQSGLEDIGRQIAAKCGGLPLVANALGEVMSELRTIKAWEDIRDTKIKLGSRDQKDTLECLMLSYYYMKLEFKMCFTYMVAFPNGFIVDSDRLIQQWVALGYIRAEDDGERCINYLLGMSFLQISWSSSVSPGSMHAKAPRELTMHDLVHDLASIIAADEFLVLDASSPEPRTWNRARYCRHAQLINYQNQSMVFRDLPAKVRSLHCRDSKKQQLPRTAFSRSKHIRVLDLNGPSVRGQSTPSNFELSNVVLPSSIHQSKLLRYLDATSLPITSLPKYFHTLQYMQTLILSKCSLETLPGNISSLHKLCYLDLSGNISLNKLPVSLGKLTKLSFLNLLGCSMLQGLPESICELTCLRHLDMSECNAIQNLPDKFGSLPKLIFLNLSGCSKLTKLPDNVRLESLEHLNLSNCHELENLPKDFGNLQKLVFLNLSDCYKVSVLPESFCQLIHLKDLDLSDCHGLSELPGCFGNLSELGTLNLTSCSKLQLLPVSFCKLIKLRHLNLSYCMRLQQLPSSLGDLELQSLDISSASSLRVLPDSISNITSLTQLEVTSARPRVFDKVQNIKRDRNLGLAVHTVHQIENKGFSSIVELAQLSCRELHVVQLQNVRNPEDAGRTKLRDKSDLRCLMLGWGNQGEEDRSVLEKLVPPRTLEQFMLNGYMSKDFPDWMSQISSYLPCITYLRLSDLGTCDTLPPFGQLPNLRSLFMQNIPNIRKIGREFYREDKMCTKLRRIQLKSMGNLVEWWTTRSGEENEEFLIPNLHRVDLIDCPKLKFLPYPPRCMLWFLKNSDEVLPQGGFGSISSSTLPFSLTILSCNFSQDKWNSLHHLPTLEIFEVQSCSGLRALPEAIRSFTSLRVLYLWSLKDLQLLPEWFGHLTCLEKISIRDCPVVTYLPESMKNLTTLRELWLQECKGLEILPEWLGQLISLQEFNINCCPKLTTLPKSIRNLTALKELYIWDCPSLVERCKGEDADMISHIREVTLHKTR